MKQSKRSLKNQKEVWRFRFILAALVRNKFGPLPSLKNDSEQRKYAQEAIKVIDNNAAFSSLVVDTALKLTGEIAAQGSGFDRRNAHQNRNFVASLLESKL